MENTIDTLQGVTWPREPLEGHKKQTLTHASKTGQPRVASSRAFRLYDPHLQNDAS